MLRVVRGPERRTFHSVAQFMLTVLVASHVGTAGRTSSLPSLAAPSGRAGAAGPATRPVGCKHRQA